MHVYVRELLFQYVKDRLGSFLNRGANFGIIIF